MVFFQVLHLRGCWEEVQGRLCFFPTFLFSYWLFRAGCSKSSLDGFPPQPPASKDKILKISNIGLFDWHSIQHVILVGSWNLTCCCCCCWLPAARKLGSANFFPVSVSMSLSKRPHCEPLPKIAKLPFLQVGQIFQVALVGQIGRSVG